MGETNAVKFARAANNGGIIIYRMYPDGSARLNRILGPGEIPVLEEGEIALVGWKPSTNPIVTNE